MPQLERNAHAAMRTKHSQKEIHTFKNAIKLILLFLGLTEGVGGVAWINEVPLFAYPASQGGVCAGGCRKVWTTMYSSLQGAVARTVSPVVNASAGEKPQRANCPLLVPVTWSPWGLGPL